MRLGVQRILDALGLRPLVAPPPGAEPLIDLTWDSRQVRLQGGFIALPGESVDGNDFLDAALAAGAKLLLASRTPSEGLLAAAAAQGAAVAVVDDPEWAFGEVARVWRGRLAAKVLGVTGSSGKTTTKELIGAALSRRYRTQMNAGNLNNLLGLPATLLGCRPETEYLVLEMGMQRKGEIARYAEISQPEMAAYTNIGLAHIEFLKTQEGIAEAKAELLAALPTGGFAVVNGDDPMTPYLLEQGQAARRGVEVLRYGLGEGNAVRATDVAYDAVGRPSCRLHLAGGGTLQLEVGLMGQHNLLNALAAATVAERLEVAPEDIQAALAKPPQLALRGELVELPGGALIINDCYNANPDSMRAALESLSQMGPVSMRIAVLGDMLELGEGNERAMHQGIGRLAAGLGLDLLVTVGRRAAWLAEAAMDAGMPAGRVRPFAEWQEAAAELQPRLAERPLILIKASRSMALERITWALQGAAAPPTAPAPTDASALPTTPAAPSLEEAAR